MATDANDNLGESDQADRAAYMANDYGLPVPMVINITPPAGTNLAATREVAVGTFVEFDVVGIPSDSWPANLYIKFENDDRTFLVHNGSAFVPMFDVHSTRTGSRTAGYHYRIKQTGGWQGSIEHLHLGATE